MSDTEALEERILALEARVRAAEDVQAICNLKSEYGALADARYDRHGVRPRAELERLAREITQLFTEDATWDGGPGLGLCQGHDAIYARFLEPTLLFSWHYFVKPRIAVDGDRATGTWDILAPCTTADGRPHWMAGAEDDEYRRVDDRWLHSAMTLRVAFMAPHERGWIVKPRA
jgi:hypothetical protein